MPKEISDKRFSGIKRDPRFRRPTAKRSKTVLDSRFKHILTDEKFRGTSNKNPRGMQKKKGPGSKGSRNKDMEQFYELETPSKDRSHSDEDIDLSTHTLCSGRSTVRMPIFFFFMAHSFLFFW